MGTGVSSETKGEEKGKDASRISFFPSSNDLPFDDPSYVELVLQLTIATLPLVPQASSHPHSVATSNKPNTFAALPLTSSLLLLPPFPRFFSPPPPAFPFPFPGSLALSPYPSFQNLLLNAWIQLTTKEFEGELEEGEARVMKVWGGMGVEGGGGRREREWRAEAWALHAVKR